MKKISTKILDKAIWLSTPNTCFDKTDFEREERLIYYKKSKPNNRGTSGSFFSKKCSKLIKYESHLEYDFLIKLEVSSNVIDFGSQPLKISYRGHTRNYYPDFYYMLNNKAIVLGEIKPVGEMGYFYNWMKWKAMKKYCYRNGMGLLITNGKTTITDLNRPIANIDFKSDLMQLFDCKKELEWVEVYDLKVKHNATMRDLTCIVIQEKLHWYRGPSKLVKV